MELDAHLLAELLDQPGAQLVAPGGGELDQACLEHRRVGRRRRPGLDREDVVHPYEHRLREQQRPVRDGRLEGLAERGTDPLAVLGVEAVARNEHQARDEAPERVAMHEQAHALSLAEREDPHRGLEQLVALERQQLIARAVGLEDVKQRLAVVAVGSEAGAVEHVGELAAQDRDRLRPLLVGERGVEAEEAPLADDATRGVELLDPDVVEERRAVHGRARVRLGQYEQLRGERDRTRALRQRRRLGLARLRLAQDPQAAACDRLQRLALAGHDEPVVAGAQEREVVLDQPLEEGAALRDLVGGRRAGSGLERPGDLGQTHAHRRPVLDRGAHLTEHADERSTRAPRAHRRRSRDRPRDGAPTRAAPSRRFGRGREPRRAGRRRRARR